MGRLRMRVFAGIAFAVIGLQAGCSADESGQLFVDLRSDLAIGREFTGVRTEVWRERPGADTPPLHRVDHIASSADDYVAGVRVAEIRGLPFGIYWVRVSLVLDTTTVLEGLSNTPVEGPTTVTVLLTRSCAG